MRKIGRWLGLLILLAVMLLLPLLSKSSQADIPCNPNDCIQIGTLKACDGLPTEQSGTTEGGCIRMVPESLILTDTGETIQCTRTTFYDCPGTSPTGCSMLGTGCSGGQ